MKKFTCSLQTVLIWPGTILKIILFPNSTNLIGLVDMTIIITQLNRWNKATTNSENWMIKKLINCSAGQFDRCPETSTGETLFCLSQLTMTEYFQAWYILYRIKHNLKNVDHLVFWIMFKIVLYFLKLTAYTK